MQKLWLRQLETETSCCPKDGNKIKPRNLAPIPNKLKDVAARPKPLTPKKETERFLAEVGGVCILCVQFPNLVGHGTLPSHCLSFETLRKRRARPWSGGE